MRQPSRRDIPKVRDRASYLYVQHARVEQDQRSVKFVTPEGTYAVPSASLTVLILGPGTSITQAAVRNLAATGCGISWSLGDHRRLFATLSDPDRASRRLLRQAALVSNPSRRLAVVRRMYEARFAERLDPGLALEQIRGLEGVRVRETYQRLARETGIAWAGRRYERDAWDEADPVNRALSAANSALYAILHAAIVQLGYSPALGFVHTGTHSSFVYDVADLYKTRTTVPAAFAAAKDPGDDAESTARANLRERLSDERVMRKLAQDLDDLLDERAEEGVDKGRQVLWSPDGGDAEAGTNYAP